MEEPQENDLGHLKPAVGGGRPHVNDRRQRGEDCNAGFKLLATIVDAAAELMELTMLEGLEEGDSEGYSDVSVALS